MELKEFNAKWVKSEFQPTKIKREIDIGEKGDGAMFFGKVSYVL